MSSYNRKCRSTKDTELDRILFMTPETKQENPDQKMYRINREKTHWTVKNISNVKFPLITKEIDWETLGKNISQDTCLSMVNYDIDFSRSDILTSNNQTNINDKISQFLKWDNSISKQRNEYYDNLLNGYQLKSRLTSGLDLYTVYDSRDINDKIWSNSNHVYWDEDVKYYRYPLESSLSSIDARSIQSKINDIPRVKSQLCLLDNYFTDTNAISNKQKKILDTFWKEIGETENSNNYSSDWYTKRKANNYSDYKKYNLNKFTNNNIKESKSLILMSIMTLESHIFNDSEDSITFKLQSLDNYKPSIEDGISTKRFNNKITYQRNKNTQTQEMHNSLETSKTLLNELIEIKNYQVKYIIRYVSEKTIELLEA
ncbi:putative ATP-dependent RNA helicase ddx42 [Aphis craccivora]|uniref:Putative ATP-dependent RNA helicase ddx42 n=1 Tax=Aphis craccivora TaxID=307492 RepID=A0A6G0Z081_APHCR|nr:putative ATP-dependent RNA helicase ddx42 [Aphis craccivora]